MNMTWLSSPHDLDAQQGFVSVNGTHPPINWQDVFFPDSTSAILYRLLLLSYTIWVITGNSLVCIGSVKAYRAGQVCPIYMCYVSGLDVLIGVCLLPTMAIIKLVGYFPYSAMACNVFVFWDYYILCAAAFGHFTLIFFFYWEVKSPDTLPRELGLHIKICVGIFAGVLLVWLPAYLADLYKADPEGQVPSGTELSANKACGFSNHNNEYAAAFLGIVGFLVPFIIGLIFCVLSLGLLWKRYHKLIRHEVQVEYAKFREQRKRQHGHHHHHHRQEPHAPQAPRLFCVEYATNHGPMLEKQPPHPHADHEAHHILHEATLVYALYFLFSSLRLPFYIYYVVGIFNSQHFPQDLSIGIYWIMDINSVLSCLFHLTLEPTVRQGVKEVFCGCCVRRSSNVKANDDVGVEDGDQRKVDGHTNANEANTSTKTAANPKIITMMDLSKGLPWPYIH